MDAIKASEMVIPDYIDEILWEMGKVKKSSLLKMVHDAIRRDGKVPTEEEWIFYVDFTEDGDCPEEFQDNYSETAKVMMDIFA